MTRRLHATQRGQRSLRVFQANVGKNPAAHDCALALADTEKHDIVLLQEPWTAIRGERCLTKTHPFIRHILPCRSLDRH
jgi:endonuclease/exonuclease/phosphatase (EEP) superfamily protein YafD